eukprot:CAMPEP_0174262486 /NCGR_PEP_ID=MMETSP0439-20130205/13004_1 /TAXON_ID=0 /ORGANISM="Stereomyxa ramosa, Strain Chinc5" /LENGTH=190 /DNA_ID=CAMNT_0015347203 /DNA_START=124 /DNA_END=696 /DNA_ORIENTATION=+
MTQTNVGSNFSRDVRRNTPAKYALSSPQSSSVMYPIHTTTSKPSMVHKNVYTFIEEEEVEGRVSPQEKKTVKPRNPYADDAPFAKHSKSTSKSASSLPTQKRQETEEKEERKEEYRWEWKDDKCWRRYNNSLNRQLNNNYRLHNKSMSFYFKPNNYVVDFESMTQTNTNSNTQRPIRKLPKKGLWASFFG